MAIALILVATLPYYPRPGMRERVAVEGVSLEVGPGAGGGFRVDATIPFDEDPPA